VSGLVNGKRGISKAQAKKLAGYFSVSAELFISIPGKRALICDPLATQ
jgi:plasmid maintenance system antidote protein VapI